MKAVRIYRTGGPEVLQMEEADAGDPGPGEVRVRHAALGLNFIDINFRTGKYPISDFPAVIGMEGAGVVEATGDGVTEVAAGGRGAAREFARIIAVTRRRPAPGPSRRTRCRR